MMMGSGRVLARAFGYSLKIGIVRCTPHVDTYSIKKTFLTTIREPFHVAIDLDLFDISFAQELFEARSIFIALLS